MEYTTSYVWDDEDRLEQIIMPSGRVVTYSRDNVRRIVGISATVNEIQQAIVSDIHYHADNRMTRCTYQLYDNDKIRIKQRNHAYLVLENIEQNKITRKEINEGCRVTPRARSCLRDPKYYPN